MEVPGNYNKTRCKYCNCELKAKYQDLKNHIKSKKHVAALSVQNITPLTNIFKCTSSSASSKIESSIAMFLSCHCAIANCDHLVDMMKNNISSKDVDDVKMHRSKCTSIIKNVLSPHFEEKLKYDIGSNKMCIKVNNFTFRFIFGCFIFQFR